jgi:hypothetical protein
MACINKNVTSVTPNKIMTTRRSFPGEIETFLDSLGAFCYGLVPTWTISDELESMCSVYQMLSVYPKIIFGFIGNRRDRPAHLAAQRIANPTYIWRCITATPREPIFVLSGGTACSLQSRSRRTCFHKTCVHLHLRQVQVSTELTCRFAPLNAKKL